MSRRGQMVMTVESLVEGLRLPPTTRVRGVEYDPRRDFVTLFVEDPGLEDVPEGCEPPVVGYVIKGEWTR